MEKMSKVNQEIKEEVLTSDASLLHWVEPEKEVKLFREPQSRLDIRKFETKVDDATEVESGAQGEIEKSHELLSKSRPGKKEGINASQSKIIQFEVSNNLGQKEVSTKQNDLNNKKQSTPLVSWRKALESAVVSETVGSRCKYQCPKCKRVFRESSNLARHYKKTRHVIWKRGELNNYLIKIVAHQCRMCHKKLLCDYTTLYSHFAQSHKITFKEYIGKTDVEHTTSKIRRKEEFKLCYAQHSDRNNFSSEVGNLCKFACSQCEYVSKGWRVMTKHMSANGHGPFLQAIQHAKKATFHRCKLCDELMLCDRYIVRDHVRMHNLTLPRYKKDIDLSSQTKEGPADMYMYKS